MGSSTTMNLEPAAAGPAAAAGRRRGALQIIRDEHASLAAMLHSLLKMLDRGPLDDPRQFFEVMRAMLFYIDEFPEKQHHAKESELLFPMLARCAPELRPVIETLDAEHAQGHDRVRALQHELLAWELLGDSRREPFEHAVRSYVAYYLHHMRVEETELLAVSQKRLNVQQHAALDAAFAANTDPLGPDGPQPLYERLYTRIVMLAPAPIGVGEAG